jgi:hypothetical protein
MESPEMRSSLKQDDSVQALAIFDLKQTKTKMADSSVNAAQAMPATVAKNS